MATDPVLRMLGLARRAGKLAYGDELVRPQDPLCVHCG